VNPLAILLLKADQQPRTTDMALTNPIFNGWRFEPDHPDSRPDQLRDYATRRFVKALEEIGGVQRVRVQLKVKDRRAELVYEKTLTS
jgi:hypothetical protein